MSKFSNREINLLNVFDRIVPSLESVSAAIFGELKDNKSRIKFLETNNRFVSDIELVFFPEQFISQYQGVDKILPEYYLQHQQNYRKLCDLLNVDFNEFWRSYISVTWFEYMLGNTRSYHTQQLKRVISQQLRVLNGELQPDKCKPYIKSINPSLMRFREYQYALDFFQTSKSEIEASISDNQEIYYLTISQLEVAKEIGKILDDGETEKRPFICPFCSVLELVKAGSRERVKCRNCEKTYNRIYKRERNPKKAWAQDLLLEKPWQCLGGCGSDQKQLNSDRICFSCYQPESND